MDISTIIAICVLALFTIVYLVCFGVMFHYSSKNYLLANNDEEIEKDIHDEYKKYLKKYDPDEEQTFLEYTAQKRKNAHNNSIFLNIIDWVICILCVAFVALAGYMKSQNQQVFLGDTSLLVIETGSMATVSDFNGYIEENNLTDQIPESSLITINKVKSAEDMELYKIYAFKVEKQVIVHRLVEIKSVDGQTTYTFKGDANAGSLDFEIDLTFDKVLGVYSGFNNQVLGTIIIYLQSPAGIIAICCAVIILLGYDIYHSKSLKAYRIRYDLLAYDAERIYKKVEDIKNTRIVNDKLIGNIRKDNIKKYRYVETLVSNKVYPIGSKAIILKVLDKGKRVKVLITDAKQPDVLIYNSTDVKVISFPYKAEVK